jgi:hypothetical protein
MIDESVRNRGVSAYSVSLISGWFIHTPILSIDHPFASDGDPTDKACTTGVMFEAKRTQILGFSAHSDSLWMLYGIMRLAKLLYFIVTEGNPKHIINCAQRN